MARAIRAVEMLLVRGTGDETSDEQPSRRAVKMRRKKAEATAMRKATCSGPRRRIRPTEPNGGL
jgi:hypothetical protein